jgi:hypothetical protein
MITKSDFQELEEILVTKRELKDSEKSIKDAIIEFKDVILHEIQGLREDVAIVTGYKDQIEDHEFRIEIAEKKLQTRV